MKVFEFSDSFEVAPDTNKGLKDISNSKKVTKKDGGNNETTITITDIDATYEGNVFGITMGDQFSDVLTGTDGSIK